MKIKDILTRAVKLLLAFGIPSVLILIVFHNANIFMGEYSVLTSDLNGQYSSYFAYFCDAIRNGNSILYTFSKFLGGDTFSLLGYYMLSPFNIILLLYPADMIATGVLYIIVLKLGTVGLTSYIYFSRKRGYIFRSLIFSTSYALMGYVCAYFMHVMWLDAIYMLPLVAIGLERMFEKKKYSMYVVTLTLSVVFCYYTGYMIAGFTLLYTAYLIFRENRKISDVWKMIATYFITTFIALGMSMVTLLPTLISQMGGHGGGQVTNYGIKHNIINVFSKLFTNSYDFNDFADGMPQIYCGTFVVVLVVLYFVIPHGKDADANKSWLNREKIWAGILFAAFVLSFIVGILDVVWHGFASPNNFNHRYSFIFVFVMILFAEKCFEELLSKSGLIHYIVSIVIVTTIALLVIAMDYDMVSNTYVLADIALLIITCVLMYMVNSKPNIAMLEPVMIGFVIIYTVGQLYINGTHYVGVHTYDDYSFAGYYRQVKPVVEEINTMDDDLYRIEKYFFNSQNDPMMLSYNGLSHFSSTEKNYVKEFAANMGYTKNYDFWAFYDKGASPAGDSLMGIRYILSNNEQDNIAGEPLVSLNGINVYKNEDALAIGNVCPSDVKSIEAVIGNPFYLQNEMYKSMSGIDKDIFSANEYKISSTNLDGAPSSDVPGETIYVRKNQDNAATLTISFVASDNNNVYMYLPSTSRPGVTVYVNDNNAGEYLSTYHSGIFSIGSFEAGTIVDIKLELMEGYLSFAKPLIYSLDDSVLSDMCKTIQSNSWSVTEHDNSHIEADINVTADDKVLLMSVPYDESWQIKVDGKDTQAICVADALMAIDVTEGSHHIVMTYHPAGLFAGIIISIVSLFVGIALIIIIKFHRSGGGQSDE